MTADEIRSRLVRLYEEGKPVLKQYAVYAQSAMALAEEYHLARLSAICQPSEETLVLTLDARETPASLDRQLADIPGDVTVKRIIYDRANHKFHLFS